MALIGSVAPSTIAAISATAGGIFQLTSGNQANLLNPGIGRLQGQVFTVRAQGYVSLPAGTYTATVQPLLYATASTGSWSAAAANLSVSASAAAVVVSSALPVNAPFLLAAEIEGDSMTELVQGAAHVQVNNGTNAVVALLNPPPFNGNRSINLQFAAGVTLANAPAGVTVTLDEFDSQ